MPSRFRLSRANLHELEKCCQPAQDAQRGWCRELRARISDRQFVRLILAKLLHRLEAVVGVDLQRRGSAGFGTKWNAGLPEKLVSESLNSAVECGIVPSGDADGERLADR